MRTLIFILQRPTALHITPCTLSTVTKCHIITHSVTPSYIVSHHALCTQHSQGKVKCKIKYNIISKIYCR